MTENEELCPLPSERQNFRVIGNPYQGYQERRRRDALQRQKAARLLSANRARNLAGVQDDQDAQSEEASAMTDDVTLETSSETIEATSGEQNAVGPGGRPAGRGGRSRRQQQQQHHRQQQAGTGGVRAFGLQYGNELMQPEWMTDVPVDLATNWLVMPRPEGLRCLLVTSRGRTMSWLRNGAPLHRFHSLLPGGSPATAGGCGSSAATSAASDFCILDCIFHQPNNTYYIQDLLCWRGYALYDCAAEFRSFWLTSKLQEEEGLAQALAKPSSVTPGFAPSTCGGGGSAAVMAAAEESPAAAAAAAPPPDGAATPPPGGSCGGARGRAWRSRRHGQPGANAADAADTEMGEADGLREEQQQGQAREPGTASVSYRIVPLPVHPATRPGLRAAYGSGRPQAPACAGQGAAAAAAALAAAVLGPAAAGPEPPAAAAAATAAAAGSGNGTCEPEGCNVDAAGDVDFLRDGLYFLHRQGHYMAGLAASPLALLWKDLGCSRYLIDTDAQGVPLEHQLTVLAYRADRTVATEDEPPVVLGRLPEAFVAAMGDKLKPGRLVRFSIRQGGITFHEGRPAGADLHYEGLANQRRGRADTFSKILFQRMARTAPITVAALAAAARVGEAAGAGGGAGAEGMEVVAVAAG